MHGVDKMRESISIIGYGRIGKLLYTCLMDVGYDTIEIITRKDEIKSLNDIILIGVPDNNIQGVVDNLNHSEVDLRSKTLAHTSGAVGLDVFSDIDSYKTKVGCMHPCMAVSDTSTSFKGITFDICGDRSFINDIVPIVTDLKAEFMIVDESTKEKLHLAAVITSNFLITLMGMAQELFRESNIDHNQLKRTLLPLMQSALKNLENQSASNALTGPIARGDYETIKRHLTLMECNPELKSAYMLLSKETLKLISSELDEQAQFQLKKILDES